MDTYIKIAQFLLSLSLLIILHELGHFIPAKIFKCKVEKFYLFFDYKFSLFKKKIGETTYGIGWIPLGGYVKIAGMIDESMDKEQMLQPPKPWEFRSKPAWQRLIIMLGGVTVNFLLGIFIYVMMFTAWGENYVKVDDVINGFSVTENFKEFGFQDGDKILKINGEEPFNVLDINKYLFLRDVKNIEIVHSDGNTEIIELPENVGFIMWQDGTMEPFKPRLHAILDSVVPESPADLAGFKKDDKLIAINNIQVTYWDQFTNAVVGNPEGVIMEIEVDRNGETKVLNVVPGNNKTIGVSLKGFTDEDMIVSHKEYSFGESISSGLSKAFWKLNDYIGQFKYVFTKKGATSLGGFIAIGSIFPSTWSWPAFWSITAFLSIMLAFMNLLPIPALDGGHVVFVLYEMITGRKPSDKFLEYAQVTGFIILMALLLFANGNDVYKWVTGKM